MRRWLLAVLVVPGLALAQTPDVTFFADLRPTLRLTENDGTLSLIDVEGRHSIVGIRIILEDGTRAYLAQRLERVEGDMDDDSIDEAFIDINGEWRIGKQYLPFGTGILIRDNAIAARFDTTLVFNGVPIKIAYADAGSDRTRGVTARVGTWWGVSGATGEHFAAQGWSLTPFRDVEDAPGEGRGYSFLLGADATVSLGSASVTVEFVTLQSGETPLDEERELSVVFAEWQIPLTRILLRGQWAHDWRSGDDQFAAFAETGIAPRIAARPFLRLDGNGFRDAGVTFVARF